MLGMVFLIPAPLGKRSLTRSQGERTVNQSADGTGMGYFGPEYHRLATQFQSVGSGSKYGDGELHGNGRGSSMMGVGP